MVGCSYRCILIGSLLLTTHCSVWGGGGQARNLDRIMFNIKQPS